MISVPQVTFWIVFQSFPRKLSTKTHGCIGHETTAETGLLFTPVEIAITHIVNENGE